VRVTRTLLRGSGTRPAPDRLPRGGRCSVNCGNRWPAYGPVLRADRSASVGCPPDASRWKYWSR